MAEQQLEGWYTDPWRRHTARWYSAGWPSALVRDGDTQAMAPVPTEPPSEVPRRWSPGAPVADGDDLWRVEDPKPPPDRPSDDVMDFIRFPLMEPFFRFFRWLFSRP